MREIVAGLFISLDGVVESPDQWQKQFDDEMGAAIGNQVADVDAMLLGRVTYEEWSAYWPTSDDPFGEFINNTPKYVVSSTLNEVSWGGFATVNLLGGDMVKAVRELKQQDGNKISIAGSATLVMSLLQNDLLDELMLMIHPIVVGKGKRFFTEANAQKQLQLVSSQATPSGTIIAIYHPAKKD